jgi:TonB family protein
MLLQSSLSIAAIYLVYHIFLRKDTFFKTNRFYLITAILFSLLIPFLDLSRLFGPIEKTYFVLLDPIIIYPEGVQATLDNNPSIFQIVMAIYFTGVIIFLFRFLFQLVQLALLIRRYGISKRQGMRFVFTDKTFSPFSFFNIVFMNRSDLESIDTQKIIAHEKVHIQQWHSLDLMLLEIITIIQWFNPFIWMYRHAVKTLHEYLADEGVLYSGVDVKVYSALLFSQSTGIQVNDLANNFSKSLLKRRFIMMTKSRTQKFARLKLMLVLPLAFSMMLVISCGPDVPVQQEKEVLESQTDAPNEADVPPPPPKIQKDEPKKTFTVVEVMPEYPGGVNEMMKFLAENIKYPTVAKENGISGKVYVTFIVEKDGLIGDITILRGIGAGCDEEAIRVIKMMPKWKPGTQRGQAVRVQYNLPIKFALDE